VTLTKTCHTSSMMQELVEAIHYCNHKSCLNRDVSIASLLHWKKIESHFETWSSDAQRINLTFVAYSFVANFVRYISAKYYLNWFSFHTVIMKVLGVNIFLKHSVVFPYQTLSQYSEGGPPKGASKCRWDRHKWRFWTNSWLSIDDCCSARSSIDGRWCSSVSQLRCTSVYGLYRHASVNTPKIREQNRTYFYAAVNLKRK